MAEKIMNLKCKKCKDELVDKETLPCSKCNKPEIKNCSNFGNFAKINKGKQMATKKAVKKTAPKKTVKKVKKAIKK